MEHSVFGLLKCRFIFVVGPKSDSITSFEFTKLATKCLTLLNTNEHTHLNRTMFGLTSSQKSIYIEMSTAFSECPESNLENENESKSKRDKICST